MIKLRRFQTISLETLYYTVFTMQVLIGAVLASLGASDTIHPDSGVIMVLGRSGKSFLSMLLFWRTKYLRDEYISVSKVSACCWEGRC